MNEQAAFEEIAHAGYLLLDRPYPASLGGTRLLVALRETPTNMHFDPETINLHWRQPNGKIEQARISWSTSFGKSRRVCAGQVVLHDRRGKPVYFFVYGGTIEACMDTTTKVCELCSPAPILEMANGVESLAGQLAAETEALLARMHANWGLNDTGFIQRMGEIDPLVLYTATLRSILSSYDHSRYLRQIFHPLYEALRNEKKWLSELGQWEANPHQLEYYFSEDES